MKEQVGFVHVLSMAPYLSVEVGGKRGRARVHQQLVGLPPQSLAHLAHSTTTIAPIDGK